MPRATATKLDLTGPIFREFRHGAQGAMAQLREVETGEAIAAHHPEVGDIDLIWGGEGSMPGKVFGLAKILKRHPKPQGTYRAHFPRSGKAAEENRPSI